MLQIPRNIELLRYRRYGGDLLLLELVRASTAAPTPPRSQASEATKEREPVALSSETGPGTQGIQDVWEALKAFLLALGDDVQMKELEHYIAFRRLKNFACVKLHVRDVQVWTRVDPASIALEQGFTRNVSQIRPCGDRRLGNPDTDAGRSGTSPATPPAQLSRSLIVLVRGVKMGLAGKPAQCESNQRSYNDPSRNVSERQSFSWVDPAGHCFGEARARVTRPLIFSGGTKQQAFETSRQSRSAHCNPELVDNWS